MSSTLDEAASAPASAQAVDLKLEVVVIPVADVDRAKRFYVGLGWRLDADFAKDDGFRVVQVTPPGSPCSIIFGSRVSSAVPGSVQGLHLVVPDIAAARAALVARGADVSALFHDAAGVFHRAGGEGRREGPHPARGSYKTFCAFADPDGNGWVLQEVTARLPGRVDAGGTIFTSPRDLAAAFRRAAAAHGEHEKRNGGVYDVNWPDWYADYMVREQAGETLPT